VSGLPDGWISVDLDAVANTVSNRAAPQNFPDKQYLGLEHVEAHTNKILITVPASTMASSSATFAKGDVLYGRMRPYLNKVVRVHFDGLASAEFIVFRESEVLNQDFLLKRLSALDFVEYACSQYEGDRPRVKFDQLGKFQLRLPPANEQTRIVKKLESLLSELDAGVAQLKAAQKKLGQYRQSLLKAAVEGSLTAQWRLAQKKSPERESGAQLLERILRERRKRWEAKQLAKFETQGKTPPSGWQKNTPNLCSPTSETCLSCRRDGYGRVWINCR
jgi:type I restriction enzyme, S subunit